MVASRCSSTRKNSRSGRTILPVSSASRAGSAFVESDLDRSLPHFQRRTGSPSLEDALDTLKKNREKYMRKTLLASAALAVVLSAPALAQQISGDVVRIGVLTDLSGVYSDFGGPGAVEAARMA